MTSQMLTFVASLATAVVLTPGLRALAVRLNIFDEPNLRKIHRKPIPLLGGIAIYLAVVVGLLFSVTEETWSQAVALLAGATVLVLVGLVDDRVSIPSRIKLLAVIPFAGLILAVGGIRITAWPLSQSFRESPELGVILGGALTILWVVAITSAFAILDHMDGLCSCNALIASVFFLIFAGWEGQFLAGIVAAAMIGANLGFLNWNLRSASIFLGDSGALFVGLVMSALAIMVKFTSMTTATSWMVPILVLGVPIFDTALVIVSRIRRGIPPTSSPGKDHAAHRLASMGLGNAGAVICLCGVSLVLGCLALWTMRLSVVQGYVLMGIVLTLAAVAVVVLERAPYERQEQPGGANRAHKDHRDHTEGHGVRRL